MMRRTGKKNDKLNRAVSTLTPSRYFSLYSLSIVLEKLDGNCLFSILLPKGISIFHIALRCLLTLSPSPTSTSQLDQLQIQNNEL